MPLRQAPQELPLPELAQQELAQLELITIPPATSRQLPVPRRMVLPEAVLRRTVLLPLREPRLPAGDEIRHDLRGCDDGEKLVVSVLLLRMPGLAPIRIPARVRAPARV
ncbi:MAG TPA: hypothetical protein VEH47_08130 [Candidatus Acidoferrales bacterium]|nr:hypothetical protein [Candidatus Acidoferrales bacterium]